MMLVSAEIHAERKNIKNLKIIIILATFAVSIIAYLVLQPDPILEKQVFIKTKKGDIQRFDVELAMTPQQVKVGLMERSQLKPRSGMLFLFDDEEALSFWMRDTLIPLDLIFITGEGVIHHIHHRAKAMMPARIYSYGAVKAVLEINAGESADLGIDVGDQVYHSFFDNEFPETAF